MNESSNFVEMFLVAQVTGSLFFRLKSRGYECQIWTQNGFELKKCKVIDRKFEFHRNMNIVLYVQMKVKLFGPKVKVKMPHNAHTGKCHNL